MKWLAENWIWIVFAIAFVAMHIFGHGGHGGHSGHSNHGGQENNNNNENQSQKGTDVDSDHHHN